MTASLGWTVAVWVGAGGGVVSGSMGTGDPSLDRLSGVWTPLEWADSAPVWFGEAGALLEERKHEVVIAAQNRPHRNQNMSYVLFTWRKEVP